ncbi:hypothetical protein [Mesomycoplasma molare]|uniref:PTS glucose transporter subunit IIB n=1 Tax=Mesomycoplasma molare TaxID=171288 RepID=A0ABY5TTX1_9BACT|nr:hypothetical protein [Mesomycoplasma molare]UWD34117.1 PTS glucose transporter subunit IIB [Mesomycoplasma molare]
MKTKDKIMIFFLTIITFGTIWIYWNSKKKNNKKNELSRSEKISFDINDLILFLGDINNIQNVENTHKKVKIYIKDSNLVKTEEIQKLKGISSTLVSSEYVNIIVGNVAEFLKEELSRKMEK